MPLRATMRFPPGGSPERKGSTMKRREFFAVAGIGTTALLAGNVPVARAADKTPEKRLQVYKCEECGTIVEVVMAGMPSLVHCGKPMTLLEEKFEGTGAVKHVPVIEKIDGGFLVKVGATAHPMTEGPLHRLDRPDRRRRDATCVPQTGRQARGHVHDHRQEGLCPRGLQPARAVERQGVRTCRAIAREPLRDGLGVRSSSPHAVWAAQWPVVLGVVFWGR